jgi:hypothetical protein
VTVLDAILVAILAPLGVTIVLETGVAVLFGLRRKGLAAVVCINCITNPTLNVLPVLLVYAGLGFKTTHPDIARSGTLEAAPTFWGWLNLCVLEVVVMLVEWRVLARVLGSKGLSSRRLLELSAVMNTVSAVLGSFILTCVPS